MKKDEIKKMITHLEIVKMDFITAGNQRLLDEVIQFLQSLMNKED